MNYLSLEEILILHEYQIEKFGGASGIRDIKLLESAVLRPQTVFDGKELYKSVFQKAAVLAISIIRNHPFADGNKRTGMHAALTFLELNGYEPTFRNKELVKLGLDVANKKADVEPLSKVFRNKTKRVD